MPTCSAAITARIPDVLNEVIFGVAYDAEQTQSYGGTSYLTLASIAATDVSSTQMINGVNNGWGGIRVPYEYVEKYFNVRNADYTTGTYDVNDKRGEMFFTSRDARSRWRMRSTSSSTAGAS